MNFGCEKGEKCLVFDGEKCKTYKNVRRRASSFKWHSQINDSDRN